MASGFQQLSLVRLEGMVRASSVHGQSGRK
jgi:hypothetical protein